MKRIISFCIVVVTFQVAAFTQCGVNYKEMLEKYCSGVYLQHQELDNSSNGKVSFMFKEGDRYAIYLLNPSKQLPDFNVTGNPESALKEVVSHVNRKDNIASYIFTAGVTGEYELTYNFKTKENACVLMAIYLQNRNLFQPGIYSNFEAMKFNNPSAPLENKIITRTVTVGGFRVTFYKLDLNKVKTTKQKKLYGFSDGKNQYIRQPDAVGLTREFLKIDNMGKYGYFEDVAYISTGSVMIPFITRYILDMNSGKITRIERKQIREILADDPELLKAFNEESQKDKKFREYLTRYYNRN